MMRTSLFLKCKKLALRKKQHALSCHAALEPNVLGQRWWVAAIVHAPLAFLRLL